MGAAAATRRGQHLTVVEDAHAQHPARRDRCEGTPSAARTEPAVAEHLEPGPVLDPHPQPGQRAQPCRHRIAVQSGDVVDLGDQARARVDEPGGGHPYPVRVMTGEDPGRPGERCVDVARCRRARVVRGLRPFQHGARHRQDGRRDPAGHQLDRAERPPGAGREGAGAGSGTNRNGERLCTMRRLCHGGVSRR